MVQPQYSPEEALNRVKLMMSYDMSKTLNENKNIIFEQSNFGPKETSEIAHKIYKSFMGDVQSNDLQDVIDMLNDEVFGKTYEDGSCLLSKVNSYIKSIKAGKFIDYFTTLQGVTFDDIKNKTLMELISMSKEEGEPEFNDIKTKLITSINGELNGFCKSPVTPPKPKTNVKVPVKSPVKKPIKSTYKPCSGTYKFGCKSNVIAKVQGCLGLVTDGKFGKKTKAALLGKGFNSFTDADVSNLCTTKKIEKIQTPPKPNIEDKYEPDTEEASDVLKQ